MKNLTLPIPVWHRNQRLFDGVFPHFGAHGKAHQCLLSAFLMGLLQDSAFMRPSNTPKCGKGSRFTYGKGFTAGVTTGFIATLLFTIFFAFYSTELSSTFLSDLSEVWSKDYSNFEGNSVLHCGYYGLCNNLGSYLIVYAVVQNLQQS